MDRSKRSKLNNKGAAMVMTIIIMAILVVFVFSLILVSYNLYASQNKNISSARNAEAVNTLSQALRDELTDENASSKSNFWKYLRTNVAYPPKQTEYMNFDGWEDWPYYDENDTTGKHGEEQAFRYFDVDKNSHIDGFPAEMTVCMYWTLPNGKNETSGITPEQKLFDSLNSDGNPKGIKLHVVIKAVTGGQVYETEEVYRLSVKNTNPQSEMIYLCNYVFGNGKIDVAGHYAGIKYDSNAPINGELKEKWIWKYEGRK